ncbi:MAG: S9 family peptidase, partial [Chloroflexi bacterium]|nr:S9 family peptidase [Chloroflexota bacterium]
GLQIWEFAISPDGKRAAAVVSDMPYEQDWYLNRLAVFDLGGETANTVHRTARQVAKPAWSPDGRTITFLTSMWSDRGSDTGAIYVVGADGAGARDVTAGHNVSYERAVWAANGSTLIASANVHARAGMVEIDVETGTATRLWEAMEFLSGYSVSDNGTIAATIESPDSPPEVFAGAIEDGTIRWRTLTDANPQARDIRLGATREVRWPAADGLEIQGLLVTPPGDDGTKPLPTVMLVHGGPTSSDHFRFQAMFRWAQIIACRGFAVLQPNYRGSVGWGLEFAERIIGDMGGLDFQDMLAGLDHLVDENIADPDRLGICGSSYGGFTACWAVTQTDRFKAAVGIASVTDYRSFHGHSYLHTWDVMYYGGSDPYDPDDRHARFSPINHVKNVKTPVLLLHGQDDRDVPVGQSHQFHRALRDRGVETELVLYQREPHVPSERAHLLDMARRIPAWFERWLMA